jgi:hypothetical protein
MVFLRSSGFGMIHFASTYVDRVFGASARLEMM